MKTFLMAALSVAIALPLCAQSLDYLSKDYFYKNYKKYELDDQPLVHLPVTVDRMIHEEFFYQDRAPVLAHLADVMTAYLDSLAWTTGLGDLALAEKGRPYVFVGSSEAVTAPPGSERMREDHDDFPPMIIYLKKPSKTWKGDLDSALREADAAFAIAINIGLAEYPKARKGFFEKKVVLGTDYERVIRFLSDEEEPVEVLQLTGTLISRNGDVIRAGAEGIIHEDTPFWAQAFDIQKGIDDDSIVRAITEYRRDDLPAKPLAWKVALETLVLELTGSARS